VSFTALSLSRKPYSYLSKALLKPVKKVSQIIRKARAKLVKAWLKLKMRRPLPDKNSNLRVAGIVSHYTAELLKPECQFLSLPADNWLEALKKFKPHLLLVESTTEEDSLWGERILNLHSELIRLLKFCRNFDIPTVFWNTADPAAYASFLNSAAKFNYVFTADLDCIGFYKKDLGHERVFLLPLACQPAVHNPVEKYDRKNIPVLFASGAFTSKRVEQDRQVLMDAFSDFPGLEVYEPPEQIISGQEGANCENRQQALKGYRYGIAVNLTTESQSNFSQHIYALLASNTPVISNYSRAARLLLGDVVINTGDSNELTRLLKNLHTDETVYRKKRLLGLRRILLEHTAEDRLNYLAGKIFNRDYGNKFPSILLVAAAKNDQELFSILDSFKNQSYPEKRLIVVPVDDFIPSKEVPDMKNVDFYSQSEAAATKMQQILRDEQYLALLNAADYYGDNYLLDLFLATRYVEAEVVGKAARFISEAESDPRLYGDGSQYRFVHALPARACIVSSALAGKQTLFDWLQQTEVASDGKTRCFAVDEFNYSQNGACAFTLPAEDLKDDDRGITMRHLYGLAESIPPVEAVSGRDDLDGAELMDWFKKGTHGKVKLLYRDNHFTVASKLAEGDCLDIYSRKKRGKKQFGFKKTGELYLETAPGLQLSLLLNIFDKQDGLLEQHEFLANQKYSLTLPGNTAKLQPGLRVKGPGRAMVKKLALNQIDTGSRYILTSASCLLITPHYPNYDDYYKNAFVHRRTVHYKRYGVSLDVFRANGQMPGGHYEFENVDVISGNEDDLAHVLRYGQHRVVLVHFLLPQIWETLKNYLATKKIIIWAHGGEIHPWHRRKCLEQETSRQILIQESEARTAFWQEVFANLNPNLHFVFVSQCLAGEVIADYNLQFEKEQYSVIHNVIDTSLFSYREKPAEQRKKILSIRPYKSVKYGNDLIVKTILELAKEPFFDQLSFHIIGDGPMFEDILAPLQGFANVLLEKRFLKQSQIAELHKTHGIYLTPSRVDSQGVSRDEAMSSGLVPVTNRVAAIPEFVDETCGMLADPEDAKGLAAAIKKLYERPDLFKKLSKNAAKRVRHQSSYEQTILKEIELIRQKLAGPPRL